jgi:DNA-binding MarR family transcriptional regulator
MEEDKLIERRSDPADRRARKLYLTAKAKPLLEEIWRLAALVRGEMFAEVPKADREVFARVLEKAHGNLCALERDSVVHIGAVRKPRNRAQRAASA